MKLYRRYCMRSWLGGCPMLPGTWDVRWHDCLKPVAHPPPCRCRCGDTTGGDA